MGHKFIYYGAFAVLLVITWFFAPYVYEITNKLIFTFFGMMVGIFIGISLQEWTKL